MSTIAGENAYSFVGSPIGNLDLWYQISDIQINPNGTQIIFSDSPANKIRRSDFSLSLSLFSSNPKNKIIIQKKKKIPFQQLLEADSEEIKMEIA